MQQKPILVVMAAGMGSRYGGLKQIDPVGAHGEAILDYSLYDARRAGFETAVLIIKREMELEFRQSVGRRLERSGLRLRYAYQQLENLPEGYAVPEGRTRPWGTAHAIVSAAACIDAPFAVVNADDYYGPQAFRTVYEYLSRAQDGDLYDYCMVGYPLRNTVTENGSVARGVCITDQNGCLTSVTERTCIASYPGGIHFSEDGGRSWADLDPDAIVSMNLWGFTPSFAVEAARRFPAFLDKTLAENPERGEYYLPSVVSALLTEGKARVRVLTSPDRWFGVTYQADKPAVVAALAGMTARGLYPWDLWGGRSAGVVWPRGRRRPAEA